MLFKGQNVFPIDYHLRFTLVLRVLCLFEELLIDVIVHVKQRGSNAVFMLAGSVGRVVRA